MTTDPVDDGPFSLAKILEEEYAALHGPLPAETTLGEKDRLAALYTHIHDLPRKRTALCLSGGGIRSATFGLGVLQGLARLSLLKQFDYLSTVSGGGYIGSWLTAWIHRHPDGVAGVTNELQKPPSDTQDPEPEPLKWLRRYSNYLSPRLGLMSVDTWTLLGTYLRNLTLNWLVLVPLLATALLFPRLLVSLVRWNVSDLGFSVSLAESTFVVGLLFGLVALANLHVYRPSLEPLRSHRIWKRFERQQWFLIGGLTPLLVTALLLTTAYGWYRNAGGQLEQLMLFGLDSRSTFVLGGAAMHGIGWLIAALLLHRWRDMNRWLGVELLVILWSGALGGLLLWSVLAETPSDVPVADFAEWYASFALPGFLTMFLLTATIFVGVASRYTDDHDREWWGGPAPGSYCQRYLGRARIVSGIRTWPAVLYANPRRVLGRTLRRDLAVIGIQLEDHGDGQGETEYGRPRARSCRSTGRPGVHREPARAHHTAHERADEGIGWCAWGGRSGRHRPTGALRYVGTCDHPP